MHHIVQENLWHEFGYNVLVDALKGQNLTYTVVKVIPFAHELIPDINPTEPSVLIWGSTTLGQIAVAKGWKPGIYKNANFDMRLLHQYYAKHMLNRDVTFCTFAEMRFDSPMFCRPVHDTKSFSGEVIQPEDLEKWKNQVLDIANEYTTLRPETLVMYTPPKDITLEARFFVVGGKIVTGSSYRTLGRQTMYQRIDSSNPLMRPLQDFAQSIVDTWQPDVAFVLDVGVVDGEPKVVEVNALNSSGFYACDMGAVLRALENL